MRFFFFHLMPYADLDPDYDKTHKSSWVTLPNSYYDPEVGAALYNRYLDELEYAAELVRYFTREPFENIVIDADTGRTAQVPAKLPVLQEFAARIGVGSSTLRQWANDIGKDGALRHPDFAAAYARARDLQQAILIQGALAGVYDSRVATLALKNLAEWRDRVDITQEGATPDKAALETNYVNRMAAAHERQRAVLQRRGLLPEGDGGPRD